MSTLAVQLNEVIPKASLNSLPVEIKAVVAKLASIQDENYANRAESKNYEQKELFQRFIERENPWIGKSLNALFSVNKEWRDLASVHLFRSLNTHKLDSLTYKFYVCPSRHQYIQSVDFSVTNFPVLMFKSLSQFENLQEITFNQIALLEIFKPDPSTPQTISALQVEFRTSIATRVNKWTLDSLNWHQVVSILSPARNHLTHLTISTSDITNRPALYCGVTLSRECLQLQELILVDIDTSVLANWARMDWSLVTQLRSLYIIINNNTVVTEIHFNFISKLSHSLVKFHLEGCNVVLPNNFTPITLSHLSQLEIWLATPSIPRALNAFTASPITSIEIHTLDQQFLESQRSGLDEYLASLVTKFSTLKTIEFRDTYIRSDNFSKLIYNCKQHGIELLLTAWKQRRIDATRTRDPNVLKYECIRLRSIADEALNYAKTTLEEFENMNNVKGIKRILKGLVELRVASEEHKD